MTPLKFFLLQHGVWTSPLSVDDCSGRVEGAIESTFDVWPVDGGLTGIAGSSWARVRRRRAWRNDFAPILVLTFRRTETGTRIEYAVGPNLFVRLFSAFWLVMVIRHGVLSWPSPQGVAVSSAMVLFFLGLMAIGGLMGRADEAWLQAYVAELIEARSV